MTPPRSVVVGADPTAAAARVATTNYTKKEAKQAVRKALEFQKRIEDAVSAALDKAAETPERAKDDDRYYWNRAWRAAFVVAADMYPDDEEK